MRGPDVIVVGGGPAGASTAFRLARQGLQVLVIERSRFPRDKPCAECLSPQASRILHEMGALPRLEPLGSRLRGMLVRSPDGVEALGDYDAPHGFRGFRSTGLGIRRDLLDQELLSCARRAGASVAHGLRVTDVLRGGAGEVVGVQALDDDGQRREFRAQVVVAADGLRSVVARRLHLRRNWRWPSRLALVAHYSGVESVSDRVELHVEHDGFVGIADVGQGVTTVAAVFPRKTGRAIAGGKDAFLAAWIAQKAQLRGRFARARQLHPACAVGPFASHARRATAPRGGALLVGDAADFFDPFTGEGVYAALRGGELAARAAAAAAAAGTPREARRALRLYDRARRTEFAGKWRVERLVALGVAWPPIVNRAVRGMASRKHLADLMAGVTGDFIPAGEVLRLSYLSELFLAPTSLPDTCR